MNGKLAINIDEEALFEVLATANFAAPPGKATVRVPADVFESTSETSWIFPKCPDPDHQNAEWATPLRLF